MCYTEVNYDGLVGTTFHFSAQALGNLASMHHFGFPSNPKQAALQGLEKMKLLFDKGLVQGVLPPHERPSIPYLRLFGFRGNDVYVLEQAYKQAPHLLAACSSASSMWCANSATVTPSLDTYDQKVHISVANLSSNLHRALEASFTEKILRLLFPDKSKFTIHPPFPAAPSLRDEGSANSIRFSKAYGGPGIYLFTYGAKKTNKEEGKLPRRQTLEASQAIARCHGIPEEQLIFARQNPDLIDKGIFHTDMAATGNLNLFFYHPEIFVDTPGVIREIEQKLENVSGCSLKTLPYALPLNQLLSSYLFNSQIVTEKHLLIAPEESKYLVPSFFEKFHFVSLSQSLKGGGGPACLRLRIILSPEEKAAVHKPALLTDSLYKELVSWINTYHREKLEFKDLIDPAVLEESRQSLDHIAQLLDLGSIYPFQN